MSWGHRKMSPRHRTLSYGFQDNVLEPRTWPVAIVQCLIVQKHVPWFIDHDLWTIEHDVWTIAHVLRTIEHVPWTIEHVLWSIEHVLWPKNMFYGP